MSEYSENTATAVNEKNSWQDLLDSERSVLPLVDIFEENDGYVLVANMPGVDKDDIHVKVDEKSLSLFGKVNFESALNKKYLLNETVVANYYRKFKLANSIDESKIEAKYENGQLVVNLPKNDKFKARIININ